ncbi:MAG TPA: UDP-N-acetylmuramate dehydrogenase [Pseudonocardiaceae bacterium]
MRKIALYGVRAQVGVPLREYTTLRLGGPARRFVTAEDTDALVGAVRWCDADGAPMLLLGGGSNLVISDEGVEGTVVRVATRGYRLDAGGVLSVAAGEDWDEVVARTVADGYGGLECLSGIPGLVGATPVQNVGAYGVEIADLLRGVDLLDRRDGRVRAVSRSGLGLGYRTSTLKNTDIAVVLRVRLALRTDGLSMPVRYAELARMLGVELGSRLPPAEVRAAVLELRRVKGMVLDPLDHDTWSAGSFFTNPVLADDDLPAMLRRITATVGDGLPVPQYPAGTGVTKLSAAWLIERAGFHRGHLGPGGRVALSTKHTLALTNRGSASTADLLALAGEVAAGVRAAFGVELHPEPVLVGCSL